MSPTLPQDPPSSVLVVALLALIGVTTPAIRSADAAEAAGPRPNVLWITTEDLSPVLGCYGDPYATTPNLDRLAAEGVRYTRAFATASVCTPARSSLITGVFASSLGTQHLRGEQPLSRNLRCFTEYLRDAGYYCSNNVKEDYNFPTPAAAWDESSPRAHWRGRKPGQPFFSVFNLMTTHQSRIRFTGEALEKLTARLKPAQRHDPAEAPLPPYYPDTPLVRQDVAQLYDLVSAMDQQVQDLLDQLADDGLAEDTIVFFYSDHGTGMPRGKRWLHESGTHVPLIIRFPEKHHDLAPGPAGSTTDRLVSFVDFAPTVLSLLGLEVPGAMQGTAFLGPASGPPRDLVFAIRDRVDEVFEFSRMVHDGRYQYIRNYQPHRARMQHSTFSELTATRKEFRRLAKSGQLSGPAAEMVAANKPPVELYDIREDPDQIRNLADSPEHREIRQRLAKELDEWMLRTRDLGLVPELEMRRRAGGESPYDVARRGDGFDLRRALRVADSIGVGTGDPRRLARLLEDQDAATRFWAVNALAARGRQAAPARDALESCLEDPAANVRFTAAVCLAALGDAEAAGKVLLDGLRSDDPAVRLYAAISLVDIGPAARPLLPQLREAAERERESGTFTMYTKWALQHAVQSLGE